MYRDIFTLRVRWFRVGWWTNLALIIMYFVAIMIEICLQCLPQSVDTLWDLQHPCYPSQPPQMVFGILNAVLDLTLLLLPVRMVWGLHMPRKQKIAVSGIFLLGLM